MFVLWQVQTCYFVADVKHSFKNRAFPLKLEKSAVVTFTKIVKFCQSITYGIDF